MLKIIEQKNFKIKEVSVSASFPKLVALPTSDDIIENVNFTLKCLQEVRDIIGSSMTILSLYRSPELNTAVGGAKNSDHKLGKSADFTCNKLNMKELYEKLSTLKLKHINKCIYYPKQNFIHLSFEKEPKLKKYWIDNK